MLTAIPRLGDLLERIARALEAGGETPENLPPRESATEREKETLALIIATRNALKKHHHATKATGLIQSCVTDLGHIINRYKKEGFPPKFTPQSEPGNGDPPATLREKRVLDLLSSLRNSMANRQNPALKGYVSDLNYILGLYGEPPYNP